MKLFAFKAILLIILVVPSRLGAQGLVWESTSTVPGSEKQIPERTSFMPGMIRQVNLNYNVVTIIRLDKKVIYTYAEEDKSYSEMTFDDMENMMKQMSGQKEEKMKKLMDQLASMPEAERKQMEERMGGKMAHMLKGGAIDVKSTGKKKTLEGYACSEYLVTKDGEEFATIWATKDIPKFASFAKDIKEFTSRMVSMMPKAGMSLGEGMKKVDGFPMMMDIKGVITTKVTKVEQKATPVAEFEVPAGYKKEGMH